jgi:glycerophosphoryl diester phosphodiesterase
MIWVWRLLLAVGVTAAIVGLVLLLLPRPTIDVQGHRGARGLAPENTLPAMATAVDLGVDTLEFDTVVTKDDVIVLSHNATLNPDLTRDANGAWISNATAIRTLTANEISQLDVGRIKPGTGYAARFSEQQPIDGTKMPTLHEVLSAYADTTLRFNIETKINPRDPALTPDPVTFAQQLVAEIRAAGVQDRTAIESFDWRSLAEVHRIAPEIDTNALTEADPTLLEDGTWTNGLRLGDFDGSIPRLVAKSGADVWSPDFATLTPDLVAEAHDLGLQVIPWTLNDVADMEQAVGMGVDGIITDYPDMAAKVVHANRWGAGLLLIAGILVTLVTLIVGRKSHRRQLGPEVPQ